MEYTMNYLSPLGNILLSADENGLTGLWFEEQKYFASTLPDKHYSAENRYSFGSRNVAGHLFQRQGAAVHASAEPERFRIPSRGAGNTAANTPRTDHDIRQNITYYCREKRAFGNVLAGSRRSGRTQRSFDNHSMSSCGRD